MAPPIFLGSFKGNFKSPMSVRNWLVQNVPCTKGPVPREWTNAIFAKLRQSYVDPAVITTGLKLARRDGYVFDDGTLPLDIATTVIKGPINTGPTMGVPSESPQEARKRAVEVLEWQFEKAQLNNNYGEMKRLAKQFADLLNSAEPGYTSEEEIQWGAPLLRRAVRRNADGSDPAPRGGRGGGGPYRALYVPVPIVEGEGEAEGE